MSLDELLKNAEQAEKEFANKPVEERSSADEQGEDTCEIGCDSCGS